LPYFEETPKFQLLMSLIHRALQWIMGRVARVVCARPGLILATGIIFAAVSIYVVATRFNVINNTTDLLSEKFEPKRNYEKLVRDFGSDYRFIVLIHSSDPEQNRLVADEVGQYLQTLKPQISSVLYKIDFSALKQRLLFTRSLDDLQKISSQLDSQLNLQKQSQAQSEQMALDLNSILDEANQKFNEKYLREKKNWTEFKPFVKQFVSILNKVTEQASGKKLPPQSATTSDDDALDDFDATEMLAQHEYFSLQDGQDVLVFAYTGQNDKDSDAPFSVTTDRIRAKLRLIEQEHSGVEVRLTGEPALDADEMVMTKIDTTKASCITLALIITLFFLSYRTFLRPAFTFLILIMGVLWSLGFALLVVGHFNVLSIAVIPMVLGIGIDFGIQILGRYEEELGQGRTVNQAVTAALQHTGVAIITGGSTTAAAFFTLCFNDFVGLAELGIIAGASMVLCIAANLVVLPAVFILRDRNRKPEQLKALSNDSTWRFIRTWDRDMVRHPRFWIAVSAVISVFAALSLPYLKFDYNLLDLDNKYADSVQTLYQVMDASRNDQGSEVSTIYASVVADNLDQARDLAKKLAALPVVAKVESVLDLVPENQDAKMPVIKRIVATAGALKLKPPTDTKLDVPRARRDIESLLSQAKEALKQAKGFAGVSHIAKDAVAAFSEMVPALDRADRALNSASVETIQQRFSASSSGAFSNMQKNMDLLRIQKADRGLTLADVPPQLQKLFLASNGEVLLQVYGKKDLWERQPDADFVNQVLQPDVAPKATGTPVLNYYATELLRVSYLWAAVWAFAAIVVLILLHFQSLKYLLLTLTPLVLAVLWRTGAMVWLNIQFNPANIVTLPLIIGIDVAFGVYIIDRYREDGKLSIFSGSTGKAIIMSSLTSLFGFSSLLVSTFRGMFDIGELMSLGIAIGLVTAIFILPQILSLLKPKADHSDTPDGLISPTKRP
jgi:hopanoid biosynthesis associated RND transporter like protein HpnN